MRSRRDAKTLTKRRPNWTVILFAISRPARQETHNKCNGAARSRVFKKKGKKRNYFTPGRHSIGWGDCSGDAALMHARKSAPLGTSRADFASATGKPRGKSGECESAWQSITAEHSSLTTATARYGPGAGRTNCTFPVSLKQCRRVKGRERERQRDDTGRWETTRRVYGVQMWRE